MLIVNPLQMEKAMLQNMFDKTGKSIEEWINIVHKQKFNQNNVVIF